MQGGGLESMDKESKMLRSSIVLAKNVNANALSRSPQASPTIRDTEDLGIQIAAVATDDLESLLKCDPLLPGELENVDFTAEQAKDPWICEMVSFKKDGTLPTDETQACKVAALAPLDSDILYYIDSKKRSCKRTVVPQHLQKVVMTEDHCGPLSGHFAVNKLYRALSTRWYWEKIYSNVENYCKSCPQCVLVSGCGHCNQPPLHPTPVHGLANNVSRQ